MTAIEEREIRGINAKTLWLLGCGLVAIGAFLANIRMEQAVQGEKLIDISRRLDRLEQPHAAQPANNKVTPYEDNTRIRFCNYLN